jgi:hypothetical protein
VLLALAQSAAAQLGRSKPMTGCCQEATLPEIERLARAAASQGQTLPEKTRGLHTALLGANQH